MSSLEEVIRDADEKNECLPADILKSFIERIERLEAEKSNISADIRDVYAELRRAGFDVKTVRAIVKLRKMDASDRDNQDALLDLYRKTLGL